MAKPKRRAPQPTRPGPATAPPLPDISHAWAVGTLVGLTLLMFGDAIFRPDARVLSEAGTDLAGQFVAWRDFGFRELAAGHLALWNPYVFSGTPFFGGFQSALLYPLNAPYLVLPLATAINLGIALHVLLAGLFVYWWTANRGLHRVACLFAATLFMFCGAHFSHVYAGHLPNLCSVPWVPLLFLSLDRIVDRRSVGWCLIGMAAVALQLLAGHPQYVFYTAVAAAVYGALNLARADQRGRVLLLFVAVYVGAALLVAVQLLPGLEASSESVRSGHVPYEFAARFSFPPENVLTMLTPYVWGGMTTYLGRHYLFEMNLFLGIAGVALAIVGVVHGEARLRRFSSIMACVLAVLALGAYTPLFPLLYAHVPGFSQLRGNSKFILQLSLFLVMLAAVGGDHVLRRRPVRRFLAPGLAASGLAAGLAALAIWRSAGGGASGWWGGVVQGLASAGESYLPADFLQNAVYVQRSGSAAAGGFLAAAAASLVLAAAFRAARRSTRAAYAIFAIGAIEVLGYAALMRPTFDLDQLYPRDLVSATKRFAGSDDRMLDLVVPNGGLGLRTADIWGNDPGVSRRYAEFIAYTQGMPPDAATQYVDFGQPHRFFGLVRCRSVFAADGAAVKGVDLASILPGYSPLPRLSLIQEYEVVPGRDAAFRAMDAGTFDPRRTVVLESKPDPVPSSGGAPGSVQLVESSTDFLTIRADLPQPSILLVSDAYSAGWQATSLPGSVQARYVVMPADYVLRAIPMAKGHHDLRLEYLPRGFRIGRWVSLAALGFYLVAVGAHVAASRVRPTA
jgi:hypothetical protein